MKKGELAAWLAMILGWCIAWGIVLRSGGVDGPDAGRDLALWAAGAVVLSAVAGVRQVGQPKLFTVVYAASFAALASFVLLAFIGPDSGMAGVCDPGEDCGAEQGIGVWFLAVILCVVFFVVMALARTLAGPMSRIARSRRIDEVGK